MFLFSESEFNKIEIEWKSILIYIQDYGTKIILPFYYLFVFSLKFRKYENP